MVPYSEMIGYLDKLEPLPSIKNNKQIEFYNIEAAFDIETTSVKEGDEKRA